MDEYDFIVGLDEFIASLKPKLSETISAKDYIDLIEYHKEKERRELYLHGEVDYYSTQTIISAIMDYNREDKKDAYPFDKTTRKPIWLHIYSPGGETVAGSALIDAMLQSQTPIYTVNDGMAMSMAGLIFIAGTKRYSMERATLMLHDGSMGVSGDVSKVKDYIEYQNKWEAKMKDFVLSHSKLTEEEYKDQSRADWYLLPDSAKEKGLVDFIIGPDCSLNDILPV